MSLGKADVFGQERPSRVLLPSANDISIKAFNSRRIRSRSQKNYPRHSTPQHSHVSTSNLGDVFQAAEQIFRNSLAFQYPQFLSSRPYRRGLNNLWRKSIMQRQYEQSKTPEMKKAMYASNYKLAEKQTWYKGRYL